MDSGPRPRLRKASGEHPTPSAAALEALRVTLHAHAAIVYTSELTDSGWQLGACSWSGPDAERYRHAFRRAMHGAYRDAADSRDYDPFAIQADQRNRALRLSQVCAIQPRAAEVHRRLFGPLGLQHHDLLRVLVCHGPRLLAWVGLLRARTFEPGETPLLQALVEPLQRSLSAQWHASSANMHRALFECLLEAISDAALVLCERGRVEYANTAALGWLDAATGPTQLAELRMALARGTSHPSFVTMRLDRQGHPGYCLALRRDSAVSAGNVVRAARLWRLSARHSQVLQHVAQGCSNKQIAAAVGCAEVTVERALTQLFRRSGTQSRTELLARMHAL